VILTDCRELSGLIRHSSETFSVSISHPCDCGQVWVLIARPFTALVFPS
jgi:hypothetical protein